MTVPIASGSQLLSADTLTGFTQLKRHILGVGGADRKVIVGVPEIALVIIRQVVDNDRLNLGDAPLAGSKAERYVVVANRGIADVAKCGFKLVEFVLTLGLVGNLVLEAVASNHIHLLRAAIVIIVLALGVMVAEAYKQGGIAGADGCIVLGAEVAELFHRGLLTIAGTPAVALAAAHIGHMHVIMVRAAAGVIALTGDGNRRQWQQSRHSGHHGTQCNKEFSHLTVYFCICCLIVRHAVT